MEIVDFSRLLQLPEQALRSWNETANLLIRIYFVTPVPVLCRLRIRSLKHIFPKSASAYVLRLSFLQFYGGIDGLIYIYILSLEFLLQQRLMLSGFRVGERRKEIDEARTDALRVFAGSVCFRAKQGKCDLSSKSSYAKDHCVTERRKGRLTQKG